jgi:hypothetical protein
MALDALAKELQNHPVTARATLSFKDALVVYPLDGSDAGSVAAAPQQPVAMRRHP